MRNTVFLAFALLAFVAAGCTIDKDFNFSLNQDFVISDYPTTTYSRSDTIDASKSSSDYNKYKADIKNIDIESATYAIISFNGPATQNVISGVLTVTTLDGTTSKVIGTISNVNLSTIGSTPQPLTLTDDGKQLLKDQLSGASSSAILNFTATTNEAPISFTVHFHFVAKATYSKSLL